MEASYLPRGEFLPLGRKDLHQQKAYSGSWLRVSIRSAIAATTISSVRNEERTLPFDVTLRMLDAMDLTPDALAKNMNIMQNLPIQSQGKSQMDIKRDRLIRAIKRLDETELDQVAEFVDLLRSRLR